MPVASFLQLLGLAAIWGGSFLFLRIAAHSFGPAYLIEARVGFAALSLLLIGLYLKKSLPFRQHWQHFMILGLFNSALPFLLFAYAAQTLNVSTLSILNSTAPIWGAVIGYVWHKTPLSPKAIAGLLIGVAGVSVIVGLDHSLIGTDAGLPIVAATMAAFCYGIATNYTKNAPAISSFDNSHGSMWAASLWVLPLLPFIPMREAPNGTEVLSVLALGIICTGLAYLLYFRLVKEIGPSPTLSVTFLIPVFGILWGYLVLGETIGLNTVLGTALVLAGTMMVTNFSPLALLRARKQAASI
ncbi:DMT family transporter [Vibrio fluvialis]|uniref:DMT family transporter n=1 Tax=Vibrio fluvialis TaxID=676 RepID=UPI00192C2A25|nr:DMT family transporter [Vibrio fluvialis]MBL4238343.1 DMT family transporter [Vibrio fluvialis]MBL4263194.1 DMT family transporter [Vibrio fluvialis]MBL4267874.1 DMT family transporter [Vibrio fluvialis]MBL4272536.1 DMT family transporter [Vibrio fluvialis]MBO1440026.1 DMT family transporter [Vibrio fluvialis]